MLNSDEYVQSELMSIKGFLSESVALVSGEEIHPDAYEKIVKNLWQISNAANTLIEDIQSNMAASIR